ncbi:hypothetical protein C8R45DRAFT_927559 [Mycena sanguinolenta]|nr:hypothetical protein C8R45DRAFT_927559 [Mycena sanguinolenta]
MSAGSPSSSIQFGNSVPNYVELAALVVPQRKLGVKDKLRRACAFLPMPLSLGWDFDPKDEDVPLDSTVPGLLLSDIESGATRAVTAHWMHALYKHTVDTHKPGTFVIHLAEAGYTTHFGWAHTLVLVTFLLQFSTILFAMIHGQKREGWLLLGAGMIRIGEGIFVSMYPKYRDPRINNPTKSRYCALHTGMTTSHILVITHRFGHHGKCVNLEDAAAPLPRKSTGWKHRIEEGMRAALKGAVWIQNGASLVTAANGYTIPAVLVLGTCVLEFISAFANALPARALVVLTTGSSVLDRITAACQVTQSISVGFVESLLPDRRGLHVDYKWISHAMLPDTTIELHPSHPSRDDIRKSTLWRRRFEVRSLLSPSDYPTHSYDLIQGDEQMPATSQILEAPDRDVNHFNLIRSDGSSQTSQFLEAPHRDINHWAVIRSDSLSSSSLPRIVQQLASWSTVVLIPLRFTTSVQHQRFQLTWESYFSRQHPSFSWSCRLSPHRASCVLLAPLASVSRMAARRPERRCTPFRTAADLVYTGVAGSSSSSAQCNDMARTCAS